MSLSKIVDVAGMALVVPKGCGGVRVFSRDGNFAFIIDDQVNLFVKQPDDNEFRVLKDIFEYDTLMGRYDCFRHWMGVYGIDFREKSRR